MRYLLLLLTLSTLLCAQLDAIPACASDCVNTAIASSSCNNVDSGCICGDITNIWNNGVPCLYAACSASDIQTLRDAVGSLCSAYGVTVTLPTPTAEGDISSIADTTMMVQGIGGSRSADTTSDASLASSAASTRQSTSSEVVTSATTRSTAKVSPTTSTATNVSPTTSSATNTSQTTSPGATGQSSTGTGTGDSKTPVGAIVGGVVGGLALLCAAGVAVFYIKRRHPRPPQDAAQDVSQLPKYEYSSAPEVVQPGQTATYYPQAASQSVEAPSYGHQPSELGGQNLGGHDAAYELPSARR